MSKRVKIYFAIFIAVAALLMYMEYTKPKPLDWTRTFSAHDKIPFGGYVLAKELPKLFPEKNICFVEDETPAAFLMYGDSLLNGSTGVFFILGGAYNSLSHTDTDMLLAFAANGNDVFWATEHLPHFIADTLKVEVEQIWPDMFNAVPDSAVAIRASLSNRHIDSVEYRFSQQSLYSYFSEFDTLGATVLGYSAGKAANVANFLKIPFGKGNFYIHLLPDAFGNYFMLKDSTYTYATSSLNYLKKDNIYWYEYKKSLTAQDDKSLLMYIFGNPPLYWAWIILLLGALLYMIFAGKRVQRIIPVIEPLHNSVVEFTRTVGNMYYNSHQHNDLMRKKIKYFLFHIKETYFMDIENIDSEFSHILHLKSGVAPEITDKIVYLVKKVNIAEKSDEDDLKILNGIIDRFYNITKRKDA